LRTGSVGNRSAEDMVNTLILEKKVVIASTRKALLDRGYFEDVEYDSINIEPVLIYSKSEKNLVFVRHKWEMSASIPFPESASAEAAVKADPEIKALMAVDDDGNRQLKFKLPDQENILLEILDAIFPK
jgi:hypothetical protein